MRDIKDKRHLLEYFQRAYEYEHMTRDQLYSRTAFAVTLLVLLLGGVGVIIAPVNAPLSWWEILAISSAVPPTIAIVAGFYFCSRSAFVATKYKHVSNISKIYDYLQESEDFHGGKTEFDPQEEFVNLMVDQFRESTEPNARFNDKRRDHFHRALRCCVLAGAFLLIGVIPYVTLTVFETSPNAHSFDSSEAVTVPKETSDNASSNPPPSTDGEKPTGKPPTPPPIEDRSGSSTTEKADGGK